MMIQNQLSALRAKLQAHDQAHVLTFVPQLHPAQQHSLLEQIESIDLVALDRLIERYVRNKPQIEIPHDLRPASYFPRDPGNWAGAEGAQSFRQAGEQLIAAGKIAAFTVAGGQGTRLGWDGPKGTYPATVVTGKPLFRVFAEQIAATQSRYGTTIPWYIMTSPINDADTRSFFVDNNYFGLSRRNVFMFPQGVLPSIDLQTGKLILADKHEIAMNPDGHGGSIKALHDSGAIEDMLVRAIEHISYFQVDNPLVRCIDPLFIGLHVHAPESSGEFSSKMVAKAFAEEKVGVFCEDATGRKFVVEYSDLPAELMQQTDDRGRLKFNAANIAIHMIGVDFVQELTADQAHDALPYHRAEKKVPYVDLRTGAPTEPKQPNAVKLETFVFDAIPLAESSIILETSRVEEFAPIKNASGVDSPASSHQLQSDRNGAWLEQAGVSIPRDGNGHVHARIEIGPLTALEPGDLVQANLPRAISAQQEIVI